MKVNFSTLKHNNAAICLNRSWFMKKFQQYSNENWQNYKQIKDSNNIFVVSFTSQLKLCKVGRNKFFFFKKILVGRLAILQNFLIYKVANNIFKFFLKSYRYAEISDIFNQKNYFNILNKFNLQEISHSSNSGSIFNTSSLAFSYNSISQNVSRPLIDFSYFWVEEFEDLTHAKQEKLLYTALFLPKVMRNIRIFIKVKIKKQLLVKINKLRYKFQKRPKRYVRQLLRKKKIFYNMCFFHKSLNNWVEKEIYLKTLKFKNFIIGNKNWWFKKFNLKLFKIRLFLQSRNTFFFNLNNHNSLKHFIGKNSFNRSFLKKKRIKMKYGLAFKKKKIGMKKKGLFYFVRRNKKWNGKYFYSIRFRKFKYKYKKIRRFKFRWMRGLKFIQNTIYVKKKNSLIILIKKRYLWFSEWKKKKSNFIWWNKFTKKKRLFLKKYLLTCVKYKFKTLKWNKKRFWWDWINSKLVQSRWNFLNFYLDHLKVKRSNSWFKNFYFKNYYKLLNFGSMSKKTLMTFILKNVNTLSRLLQFKFNRLIAKFFFIFKFKHFWNKFQKCFALLVNLWNEKKFKKHSGHIMFSNNTNINIWNVNRLIFCNSIWKEWLDVRSQADKTFYADHLKNYSSLIGNIDPININDFSDQNYYYFQSGEVCFPIQHFYFWTEEEETGENPCADYIVDRKKKDTFFQIRKNLYYWLIRLQLTLLIRQRLVQKNLNIFTRMPSVVVVKSQDFYFTSSQLAYLDASRWSSI